ncbi:MAG TPA: hypothetical protein VF296_02950 [Gallionella sp.]
MPKATAENPTAAAPKESNHLDTGAANTPFSAGVRVWPTLRRCVKTILTRPFSVAGDRIMRIQDLTANFAGTIKIHEEIKKRPFQAALLSVSHWYHPSPENAASKSAAMV